MNKRMTGNEHWQGGSRQVAIAGAVLTLLMINGSVIADPIQWTEAEGGNGHWYEQVAAGGVITWADAKVAAEQLGGHLVTLGSLEENLFISQLPLNVHDQPRAISADPRGPVKGNGWNPCAFAAACTQSG